MASMFPSPKRREIAAWCFFDFANSSFTTVIVTVVFSVYFTKILFAADASADAWWSLAHFLSQTLVIVSAPFLGAWADLRAKKKTFLFISYLVCVTFTFALGYCSPGMGWWAFGAFIVANMAFSLGENFCASFLPELSTSQNIGKISGYGWSLGYCGGLVSLWLCFPFLKGGFTLENQANLQWTSIITALFFLVAALPTFLFLKERAVPQTQPLSTLAASVFQRVMGTLGRLRMEPNLKRFFLAYFFYMCGITTVISFAAIYAEREIGFSGSDLIIFFMVIQLSSSVGAFIFGFVQDRWGSIVTLQATLALWLVVIGLAFGVRDKMIFYFVGNLAGLAIGSSQSASRAVVGLLAPEAQRAEYFGLWSMFGKLAAGCGPLAYGLISSTTGSARWALLGTGLYFIVGWMLVRQVHLARLEPKKKYR